MRWADFGPIPGNRPSSSMRSWTGPSYTGDQTPPRPEGDPRAAARRGPAGPSVPQVNRWSASISAIDSASSHRRRLDVSSSVLVRRRLRRPRRRGTRRPSASSSAAGPPNPGSPSPADRARTGPATPADRPPMARWPVLRRPPGVVHRGDDQVLEGLHVGGIDHRRVDPDARAVAAAVDHGGHQPSTRRAGDLGLAPATPARVPSRPASAGPAAGSGTGPAYRASSAGFPLLRAAGRRSRVTATSGARAVVRIWYAGPVGAREVTASVVRGPVRPVHAGRSSRIAPAAMAQ